MSVSVGSYINVRNVRNIFCAGRNYMEHAKELGNEPAREEPFFFLKPTSSLLLPPGQIRIPKGAIVHHELELAVILNSHATHKLENESDAMKSIHAYCMVLDLTARNWQMEAKKKGLPWTRAKGCDTFLPCGPLVLADTCAEKCDKIEMSLTVNGVEKQRGCTSQMIFSVPQLLLQLQRFHSLNENDMILTGTPAGVGPLQSGDVVELFGLGTATTFSVA